MPVRDQEREIQAELQRLDPELVLDKEWTGSGRLLYSVRRSRGDLPPEPILWWTDELNRPLPLSHGIVERLRSLEGRASAARRAQAANERLRERLRSDALREYEEIGRDGDRLTHPMHSALLQRGIHLRRSRDKQRARGEKV